MKKFVPVLFVFVLALTVSMFVSSCGKPADTEIAAAEEAVNAAVTAGAEEFAPQMLADTRALLEEAKTLNSQKKYDDARKKVEAVLQSANNTKLEAERVKAIPPAPADSTVVDSTAAATTTAPAPTK